MGWLISLITKGLHYVAHLILFMMMCTVTIDVLGRFFFNRPLLGAYEITSMGLAMIVFLSLAYTHLRKEHITIDFIVEKFPTSFQQVIDCLVNLLIAFLMFVICWQLWESAQRMLETNAVTGDLSLPIFIFYLIAMLGAFVFALVALLGAFTSVRRNKS